MLNAEKNKEKILDLTEGGNYFAVRKDGQNIAISCDGIKCEDCIFDEEEDCGCSFPRMKWMLSECEEPIKLSRLEYEILKWLIDKDYKYIARDSGSGLYVYYEQPPKKDRIWGSAIGDHFSICDFRDLFHFVKWEDSTPTSIQEVLDNCEVIEDAEE